MQKVNGRGVVDMFCDMCQRVSTHPGNSRLQPACNYGQRFPTSIWCTERCRHCCCHGNRHSFSYSGCAGATAAAASSPSANDDHGSLWRGFRSAGLSTGSCCVLSYPCHCHHWFPFSQLYCPASALVDTYHILMVITS